MSNINTVVYAAWEHTVGGGRSCAYSSRTAVASRQHTHYPTRLLFAVIIRCTVTWDSVGWVLHAFGYLPDATFLVI